MNFRLQNPQNKMDVNQNLASYVNSKPPSLMKDLYLDVATADVFFDAKSRETGEVESIPAHKCLLIKAAPVFDAMFGGILRETGSKIDIYDASAEGFKEFLQFFYLNEIQFTTANTIDVLNLAKKYNICELFEKFGHFLINEINIEELCWAYENALFFEHERLTKYCEDVIQTYPEEIFKSGSFQECDRTTLQCILNLPLLCREIHVLNAIYNWSVASCGYNGLDPTLKNVRSQLNGLPFQIRYDAIAIEEFGPNIPTLFAKLFDMEELKEIWLCLGGTLNPNKFTPRPLQAIEWDDRRTLVCNRTFGLTGIAYPMQRIDRAIFTSNKPILWRGFVCGERFVYNTLTLGDMPARITVAKRPNEKLFPNALEEILYTANVKLKGFENTTVTMPEPVIVKPKTLYEIRVEKLNDRPYLVKYQFAREKTMDGVKITFSSDNQLKVDNSRNGVVTTFFFNHIL